MAKTLDNLRDETLLRLGDTEQAVWTASEIDGYVKEGYKRIAEQTNCFWDIGYVENLPYSGDHTNAWEISYLVAGDIYQNEFQYTADWEIDYVDNALGPANHTAPWEWQYSYVSKEYILGVSKLPTDFYRMERVTNDWKEIEPTSSQQLEVNDRVYQTEEGDVIGYLMDKDGIRTIRKYKIPSAHCGHYDVTGDWGLLRDVADISAEEVLGTWGCPRKIPGEQAIGPHTWGIPRRCYQDNSNFRIEYFRRGADVTADDDEFELLDIHCKYIRHYAMWKALSKDGAGQDLKLGKHYEDRWILGIARMNGRKIKSVSNRVGRMGGTTVASRRPPKPVLPYHYGRSVR